MDGPEGVVAYVCPLKLELFYSSPLNCYPNVIFLLWSLLFFISELMDRILAVTYSCQLKIVIFIYPFLLDTLMVPLNWSPSYLTVISVRCNSPAGSQMYG